MTGGARSGETDEYAEDLKTIWNSLSSHAPKFRALFAALHKLKITRLGLVLMVMFLTAGSAGAGEKFTGGHLSLEVPDGWTAEYLAIGATSQIRLAAPADRVRLVIIFGPSLGGDTKSDAELLARIIDRPTTAPEPGPGRDSYHFFSLEKNRTGMEAIVFTRHPAVFTWIQNGRTDDFAKDIRTVWNSLDSSNPFYRALLDELYKQE